MINILWSNNKSENMTLYDIKKSNRIHYSKKEYEITSKHMIQCDVAWCGIKEFNTLRYNLLKYNRNAMR